MPTLESPITQYPPEQMVVLAKGRPTPEAGSTIEHASLYAFLLSRLRHCAEFVTTAPSETLSHQAKLISPVQGHILLGQLLLNNPPPARHLVQTILHPAFVRRLYQTLAYPKPGTDIDTFLEALSAAWLADIQQAYLQETRALGLLLPSDVLTLTSTFIKSGQHFDRWQQQLQVILVRDDFPEAAQAVLDLLAEKLVVIPDPQSQAAESSAPLRGFFPDSASEFQAVAHWIAEQVGTNTYRWSDFTIMLPDAAWESRMTEVCIQANVPLVMNGLPITVLPLAHILYDGLQCLQCYQLLRHKKTSTLLEQTETEDRFNQHLKRLLPYGNPDLDIDIRGLQLPVKDHALFQLFEKAETLSVFCWQLLDWCQVFSLTADPAFGQAMGNFLRQVQQLEADGNLTLSDVLAYFPSFWRASLTEAQDAVNITTLEDAEESAYTVLLLPALSSKVVLPTIDFQVQRLVMSGHERHLGEKMARHEALLRCETYGWETAAAPVTVKTLSIYHHTYESTNVWGQFSEPIVSNVVLGHPPMLLISPSAINTYMSCPRKYFYKHQLGLNEPSNDAANVGRLVHTLMELLNTQHFPERYTARQLKQLAIDLFADKQSEHLTKLNPVAREDTLSSVLRAIDDLSSRDYFDWVNRTVVRIEAEKQLTQQPLRDFPNVVLTGRIDAVFHHHDGSVTLVDYKFYSENRFTASPVKCQENWQKNLAPLAEVIPDADSENPMFDTSDSRPRDYQLYLYAQALGTLPQYRDRIRELRLQIIRPAFRLKPELGSMALTLAMDDINKHQDQLVSDLETWLLNPIRQSTHFLPQPAKRKCQQCGYQRVCEASVPDLEWEVLDDDA